MLADAGSTPAISTKYFKESQSLRWLAFFYDIILIWLADRRPLPWFCLAWSACQVSRSALGDKSAWCFVAAAAKKPRGMCKNKPIRLRIPSYRLFDTHACY